MQQLSEQAKGRWQDILLKLGVARDFLSARQGPCPVCGGKDRYRWDDKDGLGTFYCNQCGPGDGATLLMNVHGWDFAETAAKVREILGGCKPRRIKKKAKGDMRHNIALWKSGSPLMWGDPAARYIEARGYQPPYSDQLRYVEKCPYTDLETGAILGELPALIVRVSGPDGSGVRVERHYLGDGKLADIPSPKRMMPPGGELMGSAVRLVPHDGILAVAEGLFTGLAVTALYGIPCWPCLTADMLARFVWPDDVRELWIYADNDRSFAGQWAGYALAKRAYGKVGKVEVAPTRNVGTDWDDVYNSRPQLKTA